MMSELYPYALAVGIAPEYFLDRMEWWEIEAMQEAYYLRSRESWYQARTISLVAAQSAGCKVKADEFMRFPWEDEAEPEEAVNVDEFRQLREMVNEHNKNQNGR